MSPEHGDSAWNGPDYWMHAVCCVSIILCLFVVAHVSWVEHIFVNERSSLLDWFQLNLFVLNKGHEKELVDCEAVSRLAT